MLVGLSPSIQGSLDLDGQQENGEFRACWEPLITGPDVERLSQLARAMPPACRAVAEPGALAPAAAAPEVLTCVVGRLLDSLVHGAAASAKNVNLPDGSALGGWKDDGVRKGILRVRRASAGVAGARATPVLRGRGVPR